MPLLLIWSGHGYLAAVVAFGCLVATEWGIEAAMRDDRYYQTHGWPMLLGLVVAALLVALIARWLDSKSARRLVDPDTGETVVLHDSSHTLYFIPLRFWSWLFVLGGAIACLLKSKD